MIALSVPDDRLVAQHELSLPMDAPLVSASTGTPGVAEVEPVRPMRTRGHAGRITPRETEVLRLLAEGLANKQIGAQLGIGERTVKFHVSAILRKLGAANRTDAARIAAERGLIFL
jgi:DNA-binding NarL/FixJ family response regulator